jgi:hypothetical protein
MVPFEPLRLHCEHLRASNALFGAYTAPEFDFDADPDPGFHSDADPVPASQNDADPDVKRSWPASRAWTGDHWGDERLWPLLYQLQDPPDDRTPNQYNEN